jgi:drug/metabolite transporter (DMT)-like permease
MALTDLFMGISAQETSPLFTVWSVWLMFTVACFIYIASKKEVKKLFDDVHAHPWAIFLVGIFDTLGWVGFCFATERIPIGIATAIGQSFIIITILLGIFVNRERIKRHQVWGITFTVAGVIALAWITG